MAQEPPTPPRPNSLTRLWPLLLIAVGVIWLLSRGSAVTTERFSEPLGSTETARITLDLASAATRVFSLTDDNLIDAELTHVGTIEFNVSGDEHKEVQLNNTGRSRSFGLDFFSQRTKWDIGLSRDVPLDLRIDGGSGRATLELEDLNLSALELDGGSGGTTMKLPASETGARYEVGIDGGSGSTELEVADDAAVDMVIDVGSGSFTVNLGRDVTADVELSGGSGSTRINFPNGAAVRLEVNDDGSGSLNTGGGLEQVSGQGDRGVWETRGFADVEQRIVITIRAAGSGSINIR
jgi:hypothetical protein